MSTAAARTDAARAGLVIGLPSHLQQVNARPGCNSRIVDVAWRPVEDARV